MSNQASEDETYSGIELSVMEFRDACLDARSELFRTKNAVVTTDKIIAAQEKFEEAMQTSIRTEKLKLLAEVRERVVGEGELHVSHMCPQDNIHCAKFSQRCQTRNHQNAELTKMEAEL